MVATAQDAVPDDIGALRAALTAALARAEDEAARAALVEAELAVARAKASDDAALIAHQHLTIRKLQRALHGQSSERSARLHDQMELTFEELESTATEDEIAAEQAAARTTEVAPYMRKRPARQPFPEHLPRERVVEPAPTACHCCGGHRLRRLGEDITETLEVVPRQWKVIQHVREKFTCRDCEAISQAPAPFHAAPRGWAGPGLLAMVLFEKFGQHQPLNRQAERYAREGVPLSLSTLADQVGAGAAALMPLFKRLEAHVLAASRLHGDDTTVPVLAKGKTDTGRLWTYVRDDRPFGGADPPAAVFYYSRDRRGEHPAAHLAGWSGILQADAFGGYGDLYATGRQPAPVLEASCWTHSRRKVFELADIEAAARRKARSEKPNLVYPLAVEAVKRIDALFDIERAINGLSPAQRHAVRQERSAPLVTELERWMIETRDKLSRGHDLTKAFNYMLRRWSSFTRFLDDGRICLSNNAAERALRGIALGRKSWLFCGSDRGGQRAAILYSLIASAKLNDVDPQAWLADILARIAAHPAQRIDDLRPWNWRSAKLRTQPAAA
ncbi:IS66 family transposase [Mesorhizobium sp. M0166]|uniref:IS66 family transposase n=1 Tax=Mesorhizobium sp. M0166 TaxID=2956902 RepID=UPI00333D99B0